MLSEEETHETLKRLKNHPAILESLKGILDITEGAKGMRMQMTLNLLLFQK